MDEPITPTERAPERAPKPRSRKSEAEAAVRLCVVRRAELPVSQMIRFVAAPDGRLVPDLSQRLPGRGVWVDGHLNLVQTAIKKGHFQRSLKRQVLIDPDLPAIVERLLLVEARQALSLANKAGLVVAGFGKIEAELGGGRVAVLVAAQEARPDGAGKLARKFAAIGRDSGRAAPIVTEFTTADLSLAIGGENVVHAALSAGGQCRNFLRKALRLKQYRTEWTADMASAVELHSTDGDVSSTEHIGTDRE